MCVGGNPNVSNWLERFHFDWNRSQAAPRGELGARRPSGAPAQARTFRSAAVSAKTLERFKATWNCSNAGPGG